MRRQHGLTLIEVLVALALFALIGSAAYQLLLATTTTRERLQTQSAALEQWQRTLWLLQQDVEQLQRQDLPDLPRHQPYLRVEDEGRRLTLVRGGHGNPLERPRSHLQRVQYRIDQHPHRERRDSPWHGDSQRYLLRLSWTGLEGPFGDETALVQALLPEPALFQVEVLGEQQLYRNWPPATRRQGAAEEQPRALQARLHGAEGMEVVRWLRLF